MMPPLPRQLPQLAGRADSDRITTTPALSVTSPSPSLRTSESSQPASSSSSARPNLKVSTGRLSLKPIAHALSVIESVTVTVTVMLVMSTRRVGQESEQHHDDHDDARATPSSQWHRDCGSRGCLAT
jgi:hypothetical protein